MCGHGSGGGRGRLQRQVGRGLEGLGHVGLAPAGSRLRPVPHRRPGRSPRATWPRSTRSSAGSTANSTGSTPTWPPSEGETQQVVLEARRRAAIGAITRRVLALRERAHRRPTRWPALSEADRAALTTQLQEQINGLTNLSAKIQGDTDEATLRADAQTDRRPTTGSTSSRSPRPGASWWPTSSSTPPTGSPAWPTVWRTAIDQVKGRHHRGPGRPGRAAGQARRRDRRSLAGCPPGCWRSSPPGYPANRPSWTRPASPCGRAGPTWPTPPPSPAG